MKTEEQIINDHSSISNNTVIYKKTAKFATFVSVLCLILICVFVYVLGYSRYSVIKTKKLNSDYALQIKNLQQSNLSLQNKINDMSLKIDKLSSQVNQQLPTKSGLLISQLNSLVNAANQSLIVYQDYPATLQLLNTTLQLLTTTDEPLFVELKANLASDVDNLQAQNKFDLTIVQSQLNDLSLAASSLKFAVSVPLFPQSVDRSWWGRFIGDVKHSLASIIKVEEVNPSSVNDNNSLGNNLLINQNLQLNILNLKQAVITHNDSVWQQSLAQIIKIIQQFYVQDVASQKMLVICSNLQRVNYSKTTVNLDKTLQALAKVNQNYSGK